MMVAFHKFLEKMVRAGSAKGRSIGPNLENALNEKISGDSRAYLSNGKKIIKEIMTSMRKIQMVWSRSFLFLICRRNKIKATMTSKGTILKGEYP
jgi:hypothetical protein